MVGFQHLEIIPTNSSEPLMIISPQGRREQEHDAN
jgi:hypothetical protein